MAKLKATPKNYTEAAEYLAGRDSVKLGHNTWLERIMCKATNKFGEETEQIGVRLHSTYIVRFYSDGSVQLYTGGWHSVTTKERLGHFIGPRVRVHQDKYKWYVSWFTPEHKIERQRAFEEGIDISQ